MNYETTDQHVGEYPFPTVTICSQNKISKTKLNNLLPNYSFLSDQQMILITSVMMHIPTVRNRSQELLELHQLLIDNGIVVGQLINITMKVRSSFNRFHPLKLIKLFQFKVMVTCDEMLIHCQWKNKIFPCSELFIFTPTDDGYCCSFNSLDSIGKSEAK